uniref:Uncharacterized protein n=1 Tax=Bactrocera dorsalis TaxID=27457 RepID=A0A034W6P6_BACDO
MRPLWYMRTLLQSIPGLLCVRLSVFQMPEPVPISKAKILSTKVTRLLDIYEVQNLKLCVQGGFVEERVTRNMETLGLEIEFQMQQALTNSGDRWATSRSSG